MRILMSRKSSFCLSFDDFMTGLFIVKFPEINEGKESYVPFFISQNFPHKSSLFSFTVALTQHNIRNLRH